MLRQRWTALVLYLVLTLYLSTPGTARQSHPFHGPGVSTKRTMDVRLRVGEEHVLSLQNNPSTGYSWVVFDGDRTSTTRFLGLQTESVGSSEQLRLCVRDDHDTTVFCDQPGGGPVLLRNDACSNGEYPSVYELRQQSQPLGPPGAVGSPSRLTVTLVARHPGRATLTFVHERQWLIGRDSPSGFIRCDEFFKKYPTAVRISLEVL